jgi:hypothetical protein
MLGTSTIRSARTTGVIMLTGNAITARADFATRALTINIGGVGEPGEARLKTRRGKVANLWRVE